MTDRSKRILLSAAAVAAIVGALDLGLIRTRIIEALSAGLWCNGCTVEGRLQRAWFAFEQATSYFPEMWNGETTGPYDFQAVGAISRGGKVHCTGSLIENDIIVTAAHCLDGDATALEFRLGTVAQTPIQISKGLSSKCETVCASNAAAQFDLGLLRITPLTTAVAPLRIGEPTDKTLLVEKRLVVVGFGRDQNNKRGRQQAAKLVIRNVAQKTYESHDPNASVCQGDSGGPTLNPSRDRILGLTSRSYGCNGGIHKRLTEETAFEFIRKGQEELKIEPKSR